LTSINKRSREEGNWASCLGETVREKRKKKGGGSQREEPPSVKELAAKIK